jgi:hypothetical protein
VGLGLLIVDVSGSHSDYTFVRTPLGKWSAPRRDIHLTTHNAHKRQTYMPPARFEPAISASKQLQTHALDCAPTSNKMLDNIINEWIDVKVINGSLSQVCPRNSGREAPTSLTQQYRHARRIAWAMRVNPAVIDYTSSTAPSRVHSQSTFSHPHDVC